MVTDVLVSARVTQAKKDAAQQALKSIGFTTSDLINSALDYVIAEKRLPSISEETPSSLKEFFEFEEKSTLQIDWGNDFKDGNYRSIIREGKIKDYESLA